jgi:hypothetical protein
MIKFYLKNDLNQNDINELRIKYKLSTNKLYTGEKTPTLYDPNTFEKIETDFFILKCDDNKFRKVSEIYLMNQSDRRDFILNEILNNDSL